MPTPTSQVIAAPDKNDDDDNGDDSSLEGLYAVFFACLLAVPVVAGLVLLRYSDPSQNGAGSIALLLAGACCAAGLVALFPGDIGFALGAFRGDLDPDGDSEDVVFGPDLRKAYRCLYWGAMVLGFFLLPSMELVIRSGGFGLKARMADASASIAKLVVGIASAMALLTLIICAVNDDWDGSVIAKLETTLIGMANTLGTLQITLLLGFGLVELPRTLWQRASPEEALRLARVTAAHEYRCRDDARTQLGLAMDDCYRYKILAEASLNMILRAELEDAVAELLVRARQAHTRAGTYTCRHSHA